MGVKNRKNEVSDQTGKGQSIVEAQTSLTPSATAFKPTEGEPEGYEFGGPLGAALIIIASPLLMS